jgi:general secretion pathway protein D
MRFIKRVLVVLLLLALSLDASGRKVVNINFHKLQIKEFITLASKLLNKNILVTVPIKGEVDFVTTAPVYKDEVLSILISILETKGYTLVEQNSILKVIRSAEAAKHNLTVYSPKKWINERNIMVTKQIIVKEENIDVVASKVRHLISKTAKLVTIKENNTMLLTDYPNNIETVMKVIKEIQKNSQKVVEIVAIENANMKTLNQQIGEIARELFNQKVANQSVKILQNSELNALVLIGLPENIKVLKAYIVRLDKEQSNVHEKIELITLKNSDVKAVQTTLTQIISKKKYVDADAKPSVSISEEINSVILIGPKESVEPLKTIITQLDKEKYQVYVRAKIIEVSDKEADKLGMKYGLNGGVGNSSGLYTMALNFGGPAVAALDSTISSKITDSVGSISKGLALGATIDFLHTNGASKTVSEPSILCINNKESSIYVGKTQSFESGQVSSGATGTTTSYKREDIGLTLKVKPRVASDDKVTLEVEAELENVTGNDANNQPITTKQNVKTSIIANHGESIVIGGLVKDFQSNDESKVPLLGDIPLLGYAFRHNSVTDDQDHLLVVLTPYIVASSAKLSTLQENLGKLGQLQKEYNKVVFDRIMNGDRTEERLATTTIDDTQDDDPFAIITGDDE